MLCLNSFHYCAFKAVKAFTFYALRMLDGQQINHASDLPTVVRYDLLRNKQLNSIYFTRFFGMDFYIKLFF